MLRCVIISNKGPPVGFNKCIGSGDILVGVNGSCLGVLPVSCTLDKWMNIYTKLPFPRIITFFRTSAEGSILFDPLKVTSFYAL